MMIEAEKEAEGIHGGIKTSIVCCAVETYGHYYLSSRSDSKQARMVRSPLHTYISTQLKYMTHSLRHKIIQE